VLLVIVLTTATFIAKGVIPLELPQGKSAKEFPRDQKLKITISSDGKVYLNDAQCRIVDLGNSLQSRERKSPIFLSCDKNARYENFVEVLDLLKKMGFNKINIVTTR
jgi:biopolymer transport protein ExbD